MATNILGLFTSPEQYQANQMAQFRQQSANEVQLDPFQQAAIGMRQAGYQLGGGIGGALGGQDPQLQIIARRQALAGQLDPNNPQSYMQVARMAADVGDQEFAITVADAGRKALSEFALIQQRTREKLGADPFEQLVRTGKYTPTSLAKYQTSQNVADLELIEKPKTEPRITVGSDREGVSLELYDKTYIELNQTERAAVNKRVEREAAAKAPKISVDLKDPTAVAKAGLDVMSKWEDFLKSGGDVEVASRFKALQSSVALAQAGNPTADGATIFNIGKIYDPSGAVQEGDKNTILGNPSIPQKIKGYAQRVFEGGSLTPEQRNDLLSIGTNLIKGRESQLQTYRKQYISKAKTLGGNEEDILNPYQGLVKTTPADAVNQIPTGRQQPQPPARTRPKPQGKSAIKWSDLPK